MNERLALVALAALLAVGCRDAAPAMVSVPDHAGRSKSSAAVRAQRRLFDGAPPVIPHADPGSACIVCHNRDGVEVAGLGYAPPIPHELTAGLSATSRCTQCHVYSVTTELLVGNLFTGLRQDLRRGGRLYPAAPPTIPHETFMRENCVACHAGPAAREEVRCTHPDRIHCRQCHVPVTTTATFPHARDLP